MIAYSTSNYWVQTGERPHSLSQTEDNLRFEVRSGDIWSYDTPGKERSEIAMKDKMAFGTTYEISYKMMIEPGAANTADWLLLGQVHQTEDSNDMPTSPPFAIQMVGEKMQIIVRSTNDRVTTIFPGTTVLYTDTADIVRGHWYDLKLTLRFDPAGDGYVSVVRDGVTLVTYNGAVGFNDAVGGYWKEGVYREASPETLAVNYSGLTIATVDSDLAKFDPTTPLTLGGGLGADHLVGGFVNDILNGGGGADILAGGAGDDTYIVDNIGVQILEAAGEGVDTVKASVSVALAANVENLLLTGAAAIDGTGNGHDNVMTGNNAANTLEGMDGADILFGMVGNDTLDGGAGADVMYGGLGNDTYFVDRPGDQVIELAGEGLDTVNASVSYALSDNVENLILTGETDLNGSGNDGSNTLRGDAGANTLNGYGGADMLYGYAGNDVLKGGAGPDVMYGGLGDDSYFVDDSGDRVIELAGEGVDTVYSTTTFVLGSGVEHLFLLGSAPINGTGNALDNNLSGNDAANMLNGAAGDDNLKGYAGDDILYGGSGTDVLYGGEGADIMWGGAGDDGYQVDSIADKVIELANEGVDRVDSTVSYSLTNNVENLILMEGSAAADGTGNTLANIINGNSLDNLLTGGAGDDILRGNGGADRLLGGDGDDYLSGGDGNDIIDGGGGADAMWGGAGEDVFRFKALSDFGPTDALDRIGDFSRAQGDRIDLSMIDANSTVSGVQHFTFVGADEFSGHAGELRYAQTDGGVTVYGDLNGDKIADLAFVVNGSSLLQSDFIL